MIDHDPLTCGLVIEGVTYCAGCLAEYKLSTAITNDTIAKKSDTIAKELDATATAAISILVAGIRRASPAAFAELRRTVQRAAAEPRVAELVRELMGVAR